jgi:hypothetical protein
MADYRPNTLRSERHFAPPPAQPPIDIAALRLHRRLVVYLRPVLANLWRRQFRDAFRIGLAALKLESKIQIGAIRLRWFDLRSGCEDLIRALFALLCKRRD